jgi:hypothetical protein
VNINALLIGEKTVPKGCRVINVSQNGMLLYCEADGRLSTFNDGDTVDIHLTVQHAGKQKKLTIPSCVRHVAENSVDVEFLHSDPILMDLIESYRVSNQHKLEASLGLSYPAQEKFARIGNTEPPPALQKEQAAPNIQPTSHRTFYLGVLALLFTVCVAAGGYVYTASIDGRISTLESLSRSQADVVEELQNRIFSTSLQEGRYASLNARMTALGDAFAHLEDKLTMLLPATGSAPNNEPSASAVTEADKTSENPPDTQPLATKHTLDESQPRQQELEVPAQPFTNAPVVGVRPTEQPAPEEKNIQPSEQSPADTQPTAVTAETIPATRTAPPQQAGTGPWTINLISSPDKGDVNRLARLAQAANISTSVELAKVKGREYWRLQAGGYSSMAEAEQHAEPIKEALKISEVWIFRKK